MTSDDSSDIPNPTPHDVRDWLFSKNGALPAARLTHRLAAFLFDMLLLGAFTVLLLTRVLLPQFFPEESRAFHTWSRHYWEEHGNRSESGEAAEPMKIEDLDEDTWRMLFFAQNVTVILFWIYFGAADTFFSGRSLGKRMFRLKVVDYTSLSPLGLAPALIRSCLKTLCLFTLFPVFLISYLLVFFFKYRRSGHDLVSRSIVVEDNAAPNPESPSPRPPS